MRLFISVISHGHDNLIVQLNCLAKLASELDGVYIFIKKNINDNDKKLAEIQKIIGVNVLDESYGLGFGANNNYVFDFCVKEFGLKDSDYFLVLNPDVLVSSGSLSSLLETVKKDNVQLATIALFKDKELTIHDKCLRKYPTFFNFVYSFVGLTNESILDKTKITEVGCFDWAAGSFLLFKAELYRKLSGFDEKFFMYCEDIDICWRANKIHNNKLTYYPDIQGIHFAQHANRSFLSKHFFWHINSIARFLLKSTLSKLSLFIGIRNQSKIK